MSMLVGLFPPSGGDAFIDGHSIRTDIEAIRNSLGLCPQHNVLYDALTVQEHLSFFLELKVRWEDLALLREWSSGMHVCRCNLTNLKNLRVLYGPLRDIFDRWVKKDFLR